MEEENLYIRTLDTDTRHFIKELKSWETNMKVSLEPIKDELRTTKNVDYWCQEMDKACKQLEDDSSASLVISQLFRIDKLEDMDNKGIILENLDVTDRYGDEILDKDIKFDRWKEVQLTMGTLFNFYGLNSVYETAMSNLGGKNDNKYLREIQSLWDSSIEVTKNRLKFEHKWYLTRKGRGANNYKIACQKLESMDKFMFGRMYEEKLGDQLNTGDIIDGLSDYLTEFEELSDNQKKVMVYKSAFSSLLKIINTNSVPIVKKKLTRLLNEVMVNDTPLNLSDVKLELENLETNGNIYKEGTLKGTDSHDSNDTTVSMRFESKSSFNKNKRTEAFEKDITKMRWERRDGTDKFIDKPEAYNEPKFTTYCKKCGGSHGNSKHVFNFQTGRVDLEEMKKYYGPFIYLERWRKNKTMNSNAVKRQRNYQYGQSKFAKYSSKGTPIAVENNDDSSPKD